MLFAEYQVLAINQVITYVDVDEEGQMDTTRSPYGLVKYQFYLKLSSYCHLDVKMFPCVPNLVNHYHIHGQRRAEHQDS